MKKKLLLTLLLLTFPAFASNLIKKIEVLGNTKTKRSVILSEGELVPDKSYSKAELEEAKSRILNLEIFTDVNIYKKGSTLVIKVKERWTTIPILKFASGGGVSEIIAGVYDVNLFGRYVEAGGQYQRLGDRHSGVVWTKWPRLTKKLQLDLQAWKTSRIRIKYDPNSEDSVVTNGFTQTRDKIYLGLNYRKKYDEIFGIFYEYNKDEFENDLEFDDFSNSNVVLPNTTEFHIVGLQSILGRIDSYQEFYEGQRFTANLKFAFSMQEDENFEELSLRYDFFKRIGDKSNLAIRSFYGVNTNSKNIQYRLYFGGLDTIRGFKDNRFSGNSGFYNNLEWRYSTYNSENLIIQSVAFADFVSTSDKARDIFSNNAMSAGFGLRGFLPKFYRFVVRMDFAKPIQKEDEETVSFGVQQFF